ncbi:MAG TPA: hypothetical protein VI524_08430 [Anaerolineales bacterium]|nr:hypothetical protein [Anaerolineales bacterium]
MNTSSSLRWVGWAVLASAVSMILSITFNIIAVSNGSITPGTRTHSVLVEAFDVLTTGFLIPLPFAFYLIYRAYAARLSLISTLLGAIALIGLTILHILFVFEVMWFIDSLAYYAYGGIVFSLWLIITAYLAYKSHKPARGTLLNLLGASMVGFPVWTFWLGYLLASGKLTAEPD